MGEVVGTIIILAIVVFLVAIWWFLFEKAGEKGWKAIVPIYNEFILAKIAVNANFAWTYLIVCIISAFVPFVGIAALVLYCYICFRISGHFGKDIWFKILACIPFVNIFCFAHLAFNETCVYQKEKSE